MLRQGQAFVQLNYAWPAGEAQVEDSDSDAGTVRRYRLRVVDGDPLRTVLVDQMRLVEWHGQNVEHDDSRVVAGAAALEAVWPPLHIDAAGAVHDVGAFDDQLRAMVAKASPEERPQIEAFITTPEARDGIVAYARHQWEVWVTGWNGFTMLPGATVGDLERGRLSMRLDGDVWHVETAQTVPATPPGRMLFEQRTGRTLGPDDVLTITFSQVADLERHTSRPRHVAVSTTMTLQGASPAVVESRQAWTFTWQ